ncbi:alpha/beta fold hydrolase [Ammoniphilus sp. CFH 90114]|uniref:alpha/beta fold hydrolase n=1 Tax=Ammoniphilus sp. CFH 90114 TaxID=2493665 RepID=UPI00100E14F2|nr:alpha/beta hydrolase [Ammoniphilus sp. CFH 90114]RXT07118.1 alpha/beta hydrolase [Ammoniphilus sp. CFH 90114]
MRSLIGGFTTEIKTEKGIAEMKKLNINGTEQWVVMRGQDRTSPILFHLHGGPGGSQTGNFRKYLSDLEKDFVVINWDQRGAGKSYHPNIPQETMNMNQLVEDAKEVISYALHRFQQKQVFLTGQSFGSVLGMLLLHRYPEFVQAYIGINQVVYRAEEELACYETTLQIAKERGDKKAIEDLTTMGRPINGSYQNTKDLVRQRGLITKYKGVSYKKSTHLIQFASIFCSELTFKEKINFMKGFTFSIDTLWEEWSSMNLREKIIEVHVPIYFIAGKHDRLVPLESTSQYFEILKAPKKELVIFEESGHLACFEEPGKFCELLKTIKETSVAF